MTRETSATSSSPSMTFDRLCEQVRATREEREKLAWHLAMLRAKQTYELLRQ